MGLKLGIDTGRTKIENAMMQFIPIEHVGNEDYIGFRVALKEMGKHLEDNPNLFKDKYLSNGMTFRSILEGIIRSGENYPKLYAHATKHPDAQIMNLTRDHYNMAIDLDTGGAGEVLRLGRLNRTTFEGEMNSSTFGIALIKDANVSAGIAIAPRTGNLLSTAVAYEIITKGE